MAVYLTVFLAMLNQIGMKGGKMLVALYAIDLHASPFTIGMLISTYAVFPLMMAVYAGRVSDRFGVRRPMVCGSIGLALSLLIPTVFRSVPSLFISAALIGIANIFFHVASHNLTGSLGKPSDRTANFGTFSLGAAISGMIGPMMVGFLVDYWGYVPTYYALSSIAVFPGLFMMVYAGFIPARIVQKEAKQTGRVMDLVKIKLLRNTLYTSGVILTGIDLFNFYMPIHGRAIGLSASVIGVIIGMQAAAAFVVRLWMPWMARKYGEMRILSCSLLIAGLTFFLFPFFNNPQILAAISFLLGLALGCGQPLSIILTYNHSPPGRAGEALGLRLTVNKFTQILVPMIFGSLGGAFGVYPIFMSNAVLLLLGGFNNFRHEQDEPPAQ
jgi:MFS family permease